jgi:hypothetical protein
LRGCRGPSTESRPPGNALVAGGSPRVVAGDGGGRKVWEPAEVWGVRKEKKGNNRGNKVPRHLEGRGFRRRWRGYKGHTGMEDGGGEGTWSWVRVEHVWVHPMLRVKKRRERGSGKLEIQGILSSARGGAREGAANERASEKNWDVAKEEVSRCLGSGAIEGR